MVSLMRGITLFALLFCGCVASGRLPGPAPRRSWPPGSKTARIVLLGEIRGPKDLQMTGGIARGLIGLLTGHKPEDLRRPYAVAATGDIAGTGPGGGDAPGPELLAVTDTEAKVVHLFDLKRGKQRILAELAEGERLLSPVGVAFDSQKRLYVADSALPALVRFLPDGKFDRVLSRGFRRPAGVGVDAVLGLVYVSDAAEHVVRRFHLDGRPNGAVQVPFRFPTHVAVDRRGRLIVADSLNFRVMMFDPDGKQLFTTGRRPGDASGNLQRPKGVALDSDDNLYVVDALFDNVQIFNLKGQLLLAFGSAGAGPGEFALPAGIAIDQHDLIYVADAYNGRVQVFRYVGDKQ